MRKLTAFLFAFLLITPVCVNADSNLYSAHQDAYREFVDAIDEAGIIIEKNHNEKSDQDIGTGIIYKYIPVNGMEFMVRYMYAPPDNSNSDVLASIQINIFGDTYAYLYLDELTRFFISSVDEESRAKTKAEEVIKYLHSTAELKDSEYGDSVTRESRIERKNVKLVMHHYESESDSKKNTFILSAYYY